MRKREGWLGGLFAAGFAPIGRRTLGQHGLGQVEVVHRCAEGAGHADHRVEPRNAQAAQNLAHGTLFQAVLVGELLRGQVALVRDQAAQAIAARLAARQAGIHTEAGGLQPRDGIDLSRLWVTPDYDTVRAEWAASNYAIIGDIPMETGDGDTIFRLSNSPHPVVVPSGTMFPVQAVTFRGEQVTERDAVRTLIREGLIAEDRREHYADALVDYAATHGIFPSHPDYPEPVI